MTSAQVTLTLPEDLLRRAELLARRAGRPLADVLADAIELSLGPLGRPAGQAEAEPPIEQWQDERVLADADAALPLAQDQRLSELLTRQQDRVLTPPEQAELSALMHAYHEGLFRKARALREAVRRGLREPPAP